MILCRVESKICIEIIDKTSMDLYDYATRCAISRNGKTGLVTPFTLRTMVPSGKHRCNALRMYTCATCSCRKGTCRLLLGWGIYGDTIFHTDSRSQLRQHAVVCFVGENEKWLIAVLVDKVVHCIYIYCLDKFPLVENETIRPR